jgi:putative AbiEii toxin of type IV toxin-antitoxin system/AAA ATPase-like protein
MSDLELFSVKVKNLKCFGSNEQGFEGIKPVNLIIGRNNSGKSTLLDLIDYVAQDKFDVLSELWHNNQLPEFIFKSPLLGVEIKPVFRENESGGSIPGNHWSFGQTHLLGIPFSWRVSHSGGKEFIEISNAPDGSYPLNRISNGEDKKDRLNRLAACKQNLLKGKIFSRISAERDIVREEDSTDTKVKSDGTGATNIIQHFINKASLPRELVQKTLLDDLNVIFYTDANFTDIVCQQLESGAWEICLEETSKGLIPLSQSGSGLKTVILVLIYLHLVPVVIKKKLSEFVFAFEELENNVHPALLRRLLKYLHDKALSEGCIFFLTTHSNVEIDFFSKNKNTQIIHVTHDGKQAFCRRVATYIDNCGVLDDLDVRASDLLQSNGIIWVEGPSDKIYFNRWIELWSEGEFQEGNHYQCVFYGGRLLAHLSANDPDLVNESVAILKSNRNAAILIDSDKRNKSTPINETKKRIKKEIEDNHGFVWITKGKEIENYIPSSAISRLLGVGDIEQVGQYDDFFEYLEKKKTGTEKYAKQKPLLAEKLIPHMIKSDIEPILDLAERLDKLCDTIKYWNK